MIKLIIFDVWWTLAYRNVSFGAATKMLKETKAPVAYKDFKKIFENSIQKKVWPSKYAAYENLCKNMKVKSTKENVNLLMKIRDTTEATTKLYDFVIPLLKELKKKYKIGIISNSSIFAIDQVKKNTDLLKYIDYPLFSYNVGVIKPNPKFFKEMLKLAKCKPEEAIMIGDDLEDDILASRKLGINAIHFKKDYNKLKKDLASFGVFV